MTQISKQALLVENNQSFPNNNNGTITPSDLRAYNVDVIDSTVNQIVYTADSASWNQQIDSLEVFTSSQQPSFTALNSFTASQLTINSGVNSFTQSAGGRLNNLESTTSSLNAWSSSINEIRDDGVLQGYSTRLFFNGLVSASIVQNVGGAIANITIEQDGTKLNTASFDSFSSSLAETNTFTASAKISISALNTYTASAGPIATGSLVTTSSFSGTTITFTKGNGTTYTNVGIQDTASFNAYTSSVNTTTASLNTSVSNLNTFSASAKIQLSNLETTTASLNTSVSNLNVFSASAKIQLSNLEITTASLNTFSASAKIQLSNLETFSSSQLSKDATLATYTGSNDIKWTTLEAYTASVNITTASLNTYTGSNDTKWNTLGLLTGSYSTTGSNVFTGSQTITGSIYGNVVSMSIVSSTASMDLNTGNFFTLTLVSGSVTHLAASNIKTGQTINLLVSQPSVGTGSLTYNTTFKFPLGAPDNVSTITGSKDIISFISFDNSTLYAALVKNLV
jgi:hypothetical protein